MSMIYNEEIMKQGGDRGIDVSHGVRRTGPIPGDQE